MKKQKAQQRTCILVLGMHRSGTSAITGVLEHLGVDTPSTPMGAHPTNPKGFFESQKMYQLHEKLLASAGTSWSDWQRFSPGWFDSPAAGEFQDMALEALAQEFGTSRLFVLKDPRICRLMPFWTTVLAAADIRPAVLHTHRNPLEVAASLQERDRLEPGYTHLLWLRHVLDGEHDSRGLPRCFTSFSQFLEEWPRIIERAQKQLQLHWPRFSERVADDIEDFLSPDLKHHGAAPDKVQGSPLLPGWLRDTFDILERWSATGENAADHARLDTIRAEFDATGPAFGALVNKGRDAVKQLAAGTAALEAAQKKQAALEARIAAATQARADLDASLGRERANTAQALAAAETRAREAEAMAGKLAGAEAAETALRQSCAALEAELARARAATAAALALAEDEASARAAESLAADERLAGREAEHAAAIGALEATLQAAAEVRDAEFIASRTEIKRLQDRVAHLEQERKVLESRLKPKA